MSQYEYTDSSGDTLTIASGPSVVTLIARMRESVGCNYVANADAPTVAAELLKAAGQESVIVAKAADEVRVEAGSVLAVGAAASKVALMADSDPRDLRSIAANYIAIADYIESTTRRETEAAKKLQERRDALVRKFGGGGGSYAATDYPLQQAVDAYIELEDARD